MYISYNKVRMHDTDLAGILYFGRIYRFAHDAFEDLLETEGITFGQMRDHHFPLFVIVHSEADYYAHITAGDPLEVHVTFEKFGTTSFHVHYNIYRKSELIGAVKTVHVCLDTKTRKKMEIPQALRDQFSKYLATNENS